MQLALNELGEESIDLAQFRKRVLIYIMHNAISDLR